LFYGPLPNTAVCSRAFRLSAPGSNPYSRRRRPRSARRRSIQAERPAVSALRLFCPGRRKPPQDSRWPFPLFSEAWRPAVVGAWPAAVRLGRAEIFTFPSLPAHSARNTRPSLNVRIPVSCRRAVCAGGWPAAICASRPAEQRNAGARPVCIRAYRRECPTPDGRRRCIFNRPRANRPAFDSRPGTAPRRVARTALRLLVSRRTISAAKPGAFDLLGLWRLSSCAPLPCA